MFEHPARERQRGRGWTKIHRRIARVMTFAVLRACVISRRARARECEPASESERRFLLKCVCDFVFLKCQALAPGSTALRRCRPAAPSRLRTCLRPAAARARPEWRRTQCRRRWACEREQQCDIVVILVRNEGLPQLDNHNMWYSWCE